MESETRSSSASANQSVGAVGKVSLAVFLSRVLGLAREMTFAKLFGAGFANDAFVVAFLVPNLFRDLFAEGALSSAFVPTFTDYWRNKARSEAWLLASMVLSGLMVLLGAFALLLFLFADESVYLVASGFADEPGKAELTASLIRILSPFLLFVALAAAAMGMLNTMGHFFLPALAPAIFNLAIVVAGFTLAPYFESRGIEPILAMGVGALLGGFLQFGVQLPLLYRAGFRFRFRLNIGHPGIRRILRLLGPAVIGISAIQINVLVNTQMATYLEPGDGPVSWLKYAFRILYLPVGMVGVAVGIVNLRNVSVSAAAEKWEELKQTVASSLRLVSLLAIPSTVGLIVLADPIVRILFERDSFTPQDTQATALALSCYSLALIGYSFQKVLVPTFYALNDTRTPVRISLLAVAVNLTISAVLVFGILNRLAPEYAYLGLAIGTALSLSLQIVLLARAFSLRMGSMQAYQLRPTLGRMAVAALLMAGVVEGVRRGMEANFPGDGLAVQTLILAVCIGCGGVVYFGLCHWMGVAESRTVISRIRLRALRVLRGVIRTNNRPGRKDS